MVELPGRLMVKYKNAARDFQWQWQSKLSKMLPLLKTSGAICDGESAPNTERGANECGTGSDGGDKDNLSHIIVAGMIGCLSVIGGYLIGVWGTMRAITMPNDQELSHAARDSRQPETRSVNCQA